RYPQPASLLGAPEYPAHRQIHRARSYPVQGFLGRLGGRAGLSATVDIVRRSASYVDRILKGDKPADLPGGERALDSTRYAVRLGKARTHEIEHHHYEARAEHEPTRPDHIEVEIERTLQHPQRRDAGLDAKRNRLSDERQRGNHTAQCKQLPRWQLVSSLAPPDKQPITD